MKLGRLPSFFIISEVALFHMSAAHMSNYYLKLKSSNHSHHNDILSIASVPQTPSCSIVVLLSLPFVHCFLLLYQQFILFYLSFWSVVSIPSHTCTMSTQYICADVVIRIYVAEKVDTLSWLVCVYSECCLPVIITLAEDRQRAAAPVSVCSWFLRKSSWQSAGHITYDRYILSQYSLVGQVVFSQRSIQYSSQK